MELEKAISERHSCRTFLPTPVSDEQIRRIVDAARLAPSSKNRQQWKFVCVKTDKESKDIAHILQNYYIANKDNSEKIKGASSVFATGKILEHCPAIIFVFEDSDNIERTRVEDIAALLGIGGAVENMMLTATDMGLGCLWISDTYFVHEEIADYIIDKLDAMQQSDFIDNGNRLICAMALGEMGEPRMEKEKKKLEDILVIINN